MKIRRKILLTLCLVLSGVSVAQSQTAPAHEQVRYIMGTMATVQSWAVDSGTAVAAVEAAFFAFDRVDSLMSTWRDDSVLNSLNDAEAGHWIEVGPELGRVLKEAKSIAEFSGGAFDPTVFPLVRLWGFRNGRPAIPDSIALEMTLGLVDHHLLEVSEDGERARILAAGVQVDLGGIAKGYALDRAAEAMRELGATAGVVDLGGNILVFGSGPHRQVGIADPDHEAQVLAAVPLADAAAATSGQYERFVTIDGRRFGHILDPRTGWPVHGGLSVTVIAGEAMRADALATAAVVLGMERGMALLEAAKDVEGVMAEKNDDGFNLKTTSGFRSIP